MTARPPFPAPVPSQDNQPFWDALKQGELRIQCCASCGRLRHPPRLSCGECGSFEADWVPVSGRGVVYSYVVTHQAIHPAYQDHVPYASVLVELEEGVRMTSNLVDVPPGEISIGMPVRVVFERLDNEITLPLFRRA